MAYAASIRSQLFRQLEFMPCLQFFGREFRQYLLYHYLIIYYNDSAINFFLLMEESTTQLLAT